MANQLNLVGKLRGAKNFENSVLMERVAQPEEIDELGHVNNAVYLVWAQNIAVAHWTSIAGPDVITKFLWVALRHEIDYRDQILAGERVEIRTWLGRDSGARFARHVDIRKPGAKRPSAKVLTDWCLIDAETRKPRRIDAEIIDLFGGPF